MGTHIDDQENWSSNELNKLLFTFVHEFGHSLGLGHSGTKPAIMGPFYNDKIADIKLEEDDIKSIQLLYGNQDPPDSRPTPTTTTSTTTTTTRRTTATTRRTTATPRKTTKRPTRPSTKTPPIKFPSEEEFCGSNIDAIVTMPDSTAYMFKGNHYYKVPIKKKDETNP